MGSSVDMPVVWIGGAGSGVGKACAKLLAERQVRLAISGRNSGSLESIAADFALPAERVLVLPGNLADSNVAEDIAGQIIHRFGRIDALINCVGANIVERELQRLSSASVDAVLGGNLNAAFHTTLACLPSMRMRRSGTIVHVSSWAARHYSAKSGVAYTAAKQGVVALCHSINMEENDNGIRACAICPGAINTPFLDLRPVPPSPAERQAMLQPADVAEAAMFVLDSRKGLCINEIVISGVRS